MTQSDANCSPASNSPIIWENTGNFTDFGPDLKSASSQTAVVSWSQFSAFQVTPAIIAEDTHAWGGQRGPRRVAALRLTSARRRD
jgi:hypothetical protein